MTINSNQNKNAEFQTGELQNNDLLDAEQIFAEPILVKKREASAASASTNLSPGNIKRVNIGMLDSESVISPAISDKEVLKTSPVAPDYTNSYSDGGISQRPSQSIKLSFIVAGLVVLLGCAIAGAFFFSRQSGSVQANASESQVISGTNSDAAAMQPDAPSKKNPTPITTGKSSVESKRDSHNQPIGEKPVREKPVSTEVARDNTNQQSDAPADENSQAELNTSLNEWVSATNARNVDQQMNQYAPKVGAYYLSRNTSKEAVRNEKKRIFEDADAVDIKVSKPDIAVSPDGRTATMRFRKKYAIKKGQNSRNGEVLQEMKWVKSGSGWKIVGERDVKVIH